MADDKGRIEFTKEMKKTYKILFPNMLDIHFHMLQQMFRTYGFDLELLTNTDQSVIDEGLKYVHNDTCYPALLTTGQMISALKSGKYDVNHTALIMSQTGGGCRASNYIHLIRKALKSAGMPQVPVISVNLSGLEKNSGFKITLPMIRKAVAILVYGDLITLLNNQVKPYEVNRGECAALVKKWQDFICEKIDHNQGLKASEMKEYLGQIVKDFDAIKQDGIKRVKVGIVGEIYVKYCPLANNNLEQFLYDQGVEYMIPGVMGFFLFKIDNRIEDIKLYGGSAAKSKVCKALYDFVENYESLIIGALEGTKFTKPAPYKHLKELAAPVIGSGCKMGEGWLLTAEMLELIESGYGNIVSAQPFGCLPNHIVAKGMIRKIREDHPDANIVAIDYDASATKVNQENRIKLMLAVGKENLEKEEKVK